MNVVLTGPAKDGQGNAIVRADLVAALAKVGISVRSKVDLTTDYLVASRTDTVKAKTAQSLGVEVLTYPQLITLALAQGDFKIEKIGTPDPYVDADPDSLVPDFTSGTEYAGAL